MGRVAGIVDPVLLTPPLFNEDLPAFCVDVSSGESSKAVEDLYYERKMGDTELSYYLPSRQSGVNDMCVPSSRDCLSVISYRPTGTCTSVSMLRSTS